MKDNEKESGKLFDDIERTNLEPKWHSESTYEYLNLSARKPIRRVRFLLEEWFSKYPINYKKELKTRLSSQNDLTYLSAFFELFIYALFSKLGYEIDIHPDIPGESTHPDFLVLKQEKPLFFLEATLAVGPKENTAEEKRRNVVYDTIDKMESPNFFLEVKVNSSSEKSPPGRKWRSQLKKWLSGLNPDEIEKIINLKGLESIKKKTVKDESGWSVTFSPIPKSPRIRGKQVVRPVGITHIDFNKRREHEWIKNSIKRKAGNYGKLNLPYIIAVNLKSLFSQDSIIENALFGRQGFGFNRWRNNDLKMIRDFDGAFCHPPGPINKRVSAIMIFPYLDCCGITKSIPKIWHNPWASKILEKDPLPFAHVITNLAEDRFIKRDGINIADVFGLPYSWPVKKGDNDLSLNS
jgi:hypothetical protein